MVVRYYFGIKLWPKTHYHHELLLAVLILFTYSFSIRSGFPRADHVFWLHQTSDHRSLNDLLTITSWNRFQYAGAVESGQDLQLFRPGSYFVIWLQASLLKDKYFIWQILGLLVHLAVVVNLMRLCRFINKGRLSGWVFLSLCLFAVEYPSSEFTIWNHLFGYQIFALFLTGSLLLISKGRTLESRLILGLSVCLALLSVFFHEIGSLLCVAMGFWLLAETIMGVWLSDTSKRWSFGYGVVLISGPLVWLGLNFNSLSRFGIPFGFSSGKDVSIWETLRTMGQVTNVWIRQVIVPFETQTYFAGRNILDNTPTSDLDVFPFFWSVLAIGLLSFSMWSPFKPLRKLSGLLSLRILVALVGLLSIFAYSLLISVGRVTARGLEYAVGQNVYYGYFFNLFVCVAFTGFRTTTKTTELKTTRYLWVGSRVILVGLFASLIGFHAIQTIRMQTETQNSLKTKQSLANSVIDWKNTEEEWLYPMYFRFKSHELIPCPGFEGREIDAIHLRKDIGAVGLVSDIDLVFADYSARINLAKIDELNLVLLPCPVNIFEYYDVGFLVNSVGSLVSGAKQEEIENLFGLLKAGQIGEIEFRRRLSDYWLQWDL